MYRAYVLLCALQTLHTEKRLECSILSCYVTTIDLIRVFVDDRWYRVLILSHFWTEFFSVDFSKLTLPRTALGNYRCVPPKANLEYLILHQLISGEMHGILVTVVYRNYSFKYWHYFYPFSYSNRLMQIHAVCCKACWLKIAKVFPSSQTCLQQETLGLMAILLLYN